MKKPIPKDIQEIEQLIKAGSLLAARRRLKSIQFKRATPQERIALAEFSRRVGDPLTTIRTLNPIVRAPKNSQTKATASEKAIYAAALIRIGAASEALQILLTLDPKQNPETLLFQSHALFTSWKYREAIPLLQRYVTLEGDDYRKVVGKVNLAAALVQEKRHTESDPLLDEILRETKRRGLKDLRGNTLEILAQQEIQRERWGAAKAYLDEAGALLKGAGGLGELFVRKWQSVLALIRKPESPAALQTLRELRDEATRKRHWETVRECDRYLALTQKDEPRLLKVYFGTPFASYRDRVIDEFPMKLKIPDSFLWGKNTARVIRFLRGEALSRGLRLKVGQQKHRLFRALLSDLYRPIRVASLFGALYPGEFYNPVSSPTRIYQAVKECKEWLRAARLPLVIRENAGAYRLVATAECAVEIPSHGWWDANSLNGLPELRRAALDSYFSAKQASQWMGVPRRTALHLLQRALKAGAAEKTGAGPTTRYRLL